MGFFPPLFMHQGDKKLDIMGFKKSNSMFAMRAEERFSKHLRALHNLPAVQG